MSDSEEEIAIEKQIKIVFVGESNVGKSSLVRRFCFDDFTRQYNQTIGADFSIRRFTLPGRNEITIKITDVGGLELRGPMLNNYLFNSNLIILVYDITNSLSFDCLSIWIDSIRKINAKSAICGIIGNKCDLEHQRAVRLDKTQEFIKNYNLFNFLTSAKTGESVNSCLLELISKYFRIPLTKIEKEKQQCIVKAELVPPIVEKNVHQVRSLIEKYIANVRFCIIANYVGKIIPAIQSRCRRLRFAPLSSEQILPRLEYVIEQEQVKADESGKKALLTLANGDMRKVLNLLQSTWMAYHDINEDNVYLCLGHPLKSDVERIFFWLLNETFRVAYEKVRDLKVGKGYALNDIVTEIFHLVVKTEFTDEVTSNLLIKLGEIEHRLSAGVSENLQLVALVSAFYAVKNAIPIDD